jgi:anaphase-promoting complex subunit 4
VLFQVEYDVQLTNASMQILTYTQDTVNSVTYTALTQDGQDSNSESLLFYFNRLASNSLGSVHVFRTDTSIVNGISSTVKTQNSCLTLGDAKVLDLKFLYEDSLLVLLSLKRKSQASPSRTVLTYEAEQLRIVKIPHQSDQLGYQDYIPGTSSSPHVLSTDQIISVFPNMLVPVQKSFVPVQMEVKESSSERGNVPARICLLGDDLETYQVFALPAKLF